jgi:SWI/SNF-related matrix-associated actin-dependent regulator of chromatin subfamily A member 5
VRNYAKVFWARHKELPEWEKLVEKIEKGEEKLQRNARTQGALAAKLASCRNPWQELKVGTAAAVRAGPEQARLYTRMHACAIHSHMQHHHS